MVKENKNKERNPAQNPTEEEALLVRAGLTGWCPIYKKYVFNHECGCQFFVPRPKKPEEVKP
jgi:hypothetical protein